jgi:hypothetical protein
MPGLLEIKVEIGAHSTLSPSFNSTYIQILILTKNTTYR